jgi:hypothetical protein
MAVKQIIDRFINSIDMNNNYSTVELVKLLKEAAKSNKTKSTNSSGEPKVKKAPSAYNLFIKEQMELLKTDGCSPKERMQKATEKWNEMKNANKSVQKEQKPESSEETSSGDE